MEHATGGTDLGLAVALLAAGVIAVPLFRLLGLGAVLGYLTAGVLVGPFALKLFNDPQAVLHIAEFGVVMLLYLQHALQARLAAGEAPTPTLLLDAIRDGAVQRVRPKAMTVAVIIAGLLPLFWGEGTGSEVMQRIAAPMLGGMITAPLLSMFVVPAAYLLLRRRSLPEQRA